MALRQGSGDAHWSPWGHFGVPHLARARTVWAGLGGGDRRNGQSDGCFEAVQQCQPRQRVLTGIMTELRQDTPQKGLIRTCGCCRVEGAALQCRQVTFRNSYTFSSGGWMLLFRPAPGWLFCSHDSLESPSSFHLHPYLISMYQWISAHL